MARQLYNLSSMPFRLLQTEICRVINTESVIFRQRLLRQHASDRTQLCQMSIYLAIYI